MMQATWKGMISFGLVSVPVRLYSATREHTLPLHQVHASDGSRVRQRRFCEAEDREIPYGEIARSYEAPNGQTVILTSDDLAQLPVPSKKTIDVLGFVDADEIDRLSYGKPYYVGPERTGVKPYVLLRDALADASQVAVTKITLSTRESLALLYAHKDGELLVLQTVLWPDEITTPVDIAPPKDVSSRPQELKMAKTLMDTLSEDFDLADLHDEYQSALDNLVQARLTGTENPDEEGGTTEPGGTVIDLAAALERSLTAAKKPQNNPKQRKKTPTKTPSQKATPKAAAQAPRNRRTS